MNYYCCKKMEESTKSPDLSIQYYPKFREYGIAYVDGGTSFQKIKFCPWCSSKLPGSLRDKWFSEIEALGLEPGDSKLPLKFQTDEWWMKA